jgi:UTP-glucose-1-phosphate uridylyltransferase
LDYSVYDAVKAGFDKVVFVIRREFEEAFREQVGRRFASCVEVAYAFQEITELPGGHVAPIGRTKPWGTGHAVWSASKQISSPFAVINGDDYYGAESFRRLREFLAKPAIVSAETGSCMIGFKLANTLSEFGTVSRGICTVDVRGRLSRVEECTAIERLGAQARQKNADGSLRIFSGTEIVSMNCWGFSPAIFAGLERLLGNFLEKRATDLKAEFYLPAAVAELIAEGATDVAVLPSEGDWFGITYREDRPRVVSALNELIRAGVYPERLWEN